MTRDRIFPVPGTMGRRRTQASQEYYVPGTIALCIAKQIQLYLRGEFAAGMPGEDIDLTYAAWPGRYARRI